MVRVATMSFERHTTVVSCQILGKYSQQDYGIETGIIKQIARKIENLMVPNGRGN